MSFGFTRTAAGRRRLPGPESGPCAEPDATEHVPEPDFVRAMEDRELQRYPWGRGREAEWRMRELY